MALSNTSYVELHTSLVRMFTEKIKPIPKHIFSGERKPTLNDYYQLNDAVFPEHISRHFSLPNFFANYNYFASTKFSAAKFEGRFEIACASWYWGIDNTRSFSRRHSNVLINFLLAAIVEARPQDIRDKELFEFIQKFRHAFISYNLRIADFDDQQDFLSFWYHHTKYDLIKFSARSIKKILNKVKEIKNGLPSQMPFEPGMFVDKARFQDSSLFREFALVWAVRWLVELEHTFEHVEEVDKKYNASANVFEDDLSASLAGIGMNSDLPTWLTEEHFARPEVHACLKVIEKVEPAEEKSSVMWMESQAALDRIVNSDLSAMLENIHF